MSSESSSSTAAAIEWVNAHLSSLRDLDTIQTEVEADFADTTDMLRAAVMNLTEHSSQTTSLINGIRHDVAELYTDTRNVQQRSQRVQQQIQGLIGDVQTYDLAKKNLSASLDLVEKIHMLEVEVPQLSAVLQSRDFGILVEQLRSVSTQLLSLSTPPRAPPSLVAIRGRLDEFKKMCELSLEPVFDVIVLTGYISATSATAAADENNVPSINNNSNKTLLITPDLCDLAAELGPSVKKRLQQRFISAQITSYSHAFPAHSEHSSVARTERRFAWLRRWLRSYIELGFSQAFPASWHVPHEVCVEFCLQTRAALERQMKDVEAEELASDPALALRVLHKTLEFEHELTVRAKSKTMELSARDARELDKRNNNINNNNSDEAGETGQATTARTYSYIGWISPCFESTMEAYVESASTTLRKVMDDAGEDPAQWGAVEECELHLGVVAASGADVFGCIKDSYDGLVAVCQGAPLASMADRYDEHLTRYADKLVWKAPGSDVHTDAALKQLCVLLNTCDMCQTTVSTVLEEISSKIDKLYADRVIFSRSIEAFSQSYSRLVSHFLHAVQLRMLPAAKQIMEIDWSKFEGAMDILDEGEYVRLIRQQLHDSLGIAHRLLTPTVFRFTCDKIASLLVPRLIACVYKERFISADACHQLRIDFGALERAFLNVPGVKDVSSAFTRIVRKEFAFVNALLQVLMCDVASPTIVDTYFEFIPVAYRSVTDFTRVLDLKHPHGAEQQQQQQQHRQALIDALRRRGVPESVPADAQKNVAFDSPIITPVSVDSAGNTNAITPTSASLGVPSYSGDENNNTNVFAANIRNRLKEAFSKKDQS
eukprot:PhM_4_TR19073/c2_g1_i1/m.93/K20299/VPS53; vacuolar protein sorting-associated protein 53